MDSGSNKVLDRLTASKWTKIFILLAFAQIIISLPILAVTFSKVSSQSIAWNLPFKPWRVVIECLWFIIFELWQLWLVLDGVVHCHSMTIIAVAAFAFFSSALGLMQIVETVKWMHNEGEPQVTMLEFNLKLQITLTVLTFLVSIPSSFVAYYLLKDFGWHVYKKLGAELKVQNMYHTAKWFMLVIKIDVFFETFLMVFHAVYGGDVAILWVSSTTMAVLSLIALALGRKAVADEKHWEILLFDVYQVLVIIFNIVVLYYDVDPKDIWDTMVVYGVASMCMALVTLYFSIRCQLNFNKGLKPFVSWEPFREESSVPEIIKDEKNMELISDDEDDDVEQALYSSRA